MSSGVFEFGAGMWAAALAAFVVSGCGSNDEHGDGGAGGVTDGGGREEGSTGGRNGIDGATGTAGTGGGSTGGNAGMGGEGGTPIASVGCGRATCDTISGSIQGFPVALFPCCSESVRCGLDLAPLAAAGAVVPLGCTELEQPGRLDDTCPAQGSVVGAELPGCCLPSGVCGVIANFGEMRLGCVDPTDYGLEFDGGSKTCAPSAADGGPEAGADGAATVDGGLTDASGGGADASMNADGETVTGEDGATKEAGSDQG